MTRISIGLDCSASCLGLEIGIRHDRKALKSAIDVETNLFRFDYYYTVVDATYFGQVIDESQLWTGHGSHRLKALR